MANVIADGSTGELGDTGPANGLQRTDEPERQEGRDHERSGQVTKPHGNTGKGEIARGGGRGIRQGERRRGDECCRE